MNHLVVMPILLPALAAGLLLAVGDRRLTATRIVSLAATLLTAVCAAMLMAQAATGMHQVYLLGDWPAPFGIVLVLDRLSALLLLLTGIVAVAACTYAACGWDSRGGHFHVLFQFQLMGLNGAFLTGDLFNLFVFFEVLLIASYCLLLHGLGLPRLRAAMHYVLLNLTGSAVFLIAVSLLYGVTGTLNMAHLAERLTQLPPVDVPLAHAAGLILLGIFGLKAALLPLHFWLPAAYSSASAPVAVLFAIMTKVGVYAIVRVSTLVFGADGGIAHFAPWLLPVALTTLAVAALGALAAERLSACAAYLTVGSVGTMLAAFATGGAEALAAALFYLVHSTFGAAALFLLAELAGRRRGAAGDAIGSGDVTVNCALLGVTFLLVAASVAGLPPTSGFLGKLMILQAVRETPAAAWIWLVILAAGLITLLACVRAGISLFWDGKQERAGNVAEPSSAEWTPLVLLVACSMLLMVAAAPVKRHIDATAAQITDRADYIAAVLGASPERAPRALRERGGQ
ncbi:MAG: monovalent cation/H+ antiporter subunit D [Betaproteobacteria bacterium]|jgi:multicomponent K+:H+ antiporter subunit D|nr:monovalent cation/H+ antiporter subunit D [Betaproteobacteria bacterium]